MKMSREKEYPEEFLQALKELEEEGVIEITIEELEDD
jgi:hypothetical protein